MARAPKAPTPSTDELTIVYRAPAALLGYENNARTHSEGQIAQIAASMREFGFTNPILIDEKNTIIAGHGRLAAASKIGLKTVPTITLAGLSAAQRKALVIADNKLALNAGWDLDILHLELSELRASGFNLDLTGYSTLELADIFATKTGMTDPDHEVPTETVEITKLGDVWVLDGHRLVCGDSTDPKTVKRALNGAKPGLMVTDPPYGVDYDPNWRNEAARTSKGMGNRAIGAGAVGKVKNDDRSDWRAAWQLFPGEVAYVWHAGVNADIVAASMKVAEFDMRAQIIWVKSTMVIGRGHYHWQHEPCWYAVRKGAAGNWKGGRKQTTVWEIDKQKSNETGHSTQKPVECMKRPIENHTDPGDLVYEPFAGSGTTVIAAEMTGRKCYAIELNPAYVDVCVRRWQTFTGKHALLEGDGRTFGDVAEERVTKAA